MFKVINFKEKPLKASGRNPFLNFFKPFFRKVIFSVNFDEDSASA